MTIGIKAINSKDLKVINCTFSNLDMDIELNNVEGFTSINNRFSQNDPKVILTNLYGEIFSSNLSEDSKRTLFKEVVRSLSNKTNFQNNVENDQTIKRRLLRLVGNKALEYFVQLAAVVSAGLIIREI